MSVRTFLFLIVSCCIVAKAIAADRLWLRADINNSPMKLAFRSSESGILLFREAAERAGLQLKIGRNAPEQRATRWTVENCSVALRWSAFNKTVLTSRVDVLELPTNYPAGFRSGDGYLGWGTVRENIVEIDAEEASFRFLDKVPKKVEGWIRARVQDNQAPNQECLVLEFLGLDAKPIPVAVDTGLESGLGLPPKQWRDWDRMNPGSPRTLELLATSDGKLLDVEVGWARHLNIGRLGLTDVIVEEADSKNRSRGRGVYIPVMGLNALARLDIIIDGPKGVAYLKPKKPGARHVSHNRLGLLFVPADDNKTCIALVAENSPADQAGIRYGDVLVSLNGRQIGAPDMKELNRIHEWFQLAAVGTRAPMVLRRGGLTFEARPVFQNILPPGR